MFGCSVRTWEVDRGLLLSEVCLRDAICEKTSEMRYLSVFSVESVSRCVREHENTSVNSVPEARRVNHEMLWAKAIGIVSAECNVGRGISAEVFSVPLYARE